MILLLVQIVGQSTTGTSDFFGLNHYTTNVISACTEKKSGPSFENDMNVSTTQPDDWPRTAAMWLRVYPAGFRTALCAIKHMYNNPIIYVTENGYPDNGDSDDSGRISYFNSYLHEMLKAVSSGVRIQVYTAWSLIDSFEWLSGYSERFGIFQVDFNDPKRKRTMKKSGEYFKNIYRNRQLLDCSAIS